MHHTILSILCLYINSKPDHRYTYSLVQVALISLFLSEDYDILIVV